MGGRHRAAGSVRPGHSVLCERDWLRIQQALRLSQREAQIVRFIFDDLKESAIGHELGISRHTVHTYLARLFRKLDVSSRCELIIRVFAELQRLD